MAQLVAAQAPNVITLDGGKLTLFTALPNRDEVLRADEHQRQVELNDMSKHIVLTCGFGCLLSARKPFISITLEPTTTMPNDQCDLSGWYIQCGLERVAVLPAGTIVRHGSPLTLCGSAIDPAPYDSHRSMFLRRTHVSLFKPGRGVDASPVQVSYCKFPGSEPNPVYAAYDADRERTHHEMMGMFVGMAFILLIPIMGLFLHAIFPRDTKMESFTQIDSDRFLRTDETQLQSINNPNLIASIINGHLTVSRLNKNNGQRESSKLWSMPLFDITSDTSTTTANKKFMLGFDPNGHLVARVPGTLGNIWWSKTCGDLADETVSRRCSYMELDNNGKLIVYNAQGEKVMTLNDLPELPALKNTLVVGK